MQTAAMYDFCQGVALAALSAGTSRRLGKAALYLLLARRGHYRLTALSLGRIARIVAGVISNFFSSNNDEESSSTGGFAYMITVFVLEMAFGVLASMIVMWFSRQREFRADAGAAKLAGRDKMIAALQRLSRGAEPQMEGAMMAFGINGKRSMSELFMSHPPIEQRIAALRG